MLPHLVNKNGESSQHNSTYTNSSNVGKIISSVSASPVWPAPKGLQVLRQICLSLPPQCVLQQSQWGLKEATAVFELKHILSPRSIARLRKIRMVQKVTVQNSCNHREFSGAMILHPQCCAAVKLSISPAEPCQYWTSKEHN
ncbi:hypothetical protein TraAM80_09283 [Trypanosoma rangeli]|uniref:Uncharacterized protein n=1 Tax=Trypanosoma rangeli TaxID=5698 RepID=A0A3R7M7I9_TRYRA|nr:uncharacterized protein TraAM80_09283 [Trypanosoma rangeli]RNE97591.1 hypothetical protein TraAM80_09283 [Trypanosoma rangeli]|eukprot:RNE97591.1 hypothetical protein TraAM80_09283 [Trypanosoma rangeli]